MLSANLLGSRGDVLLLPGAFNDGRVILRHHDLLGGSQLVQLDGLKRSTNVFAEERAGGECCDVAEHCLAPIAKARRLDCANLQHASQTIDNERCERFVLNVFSDEEQALAAGRDLVEEGQEVTQVGDFLLV